MTANNVLSTPDGVILVSDTATYSPANVIVGFGSKSYVNERHRWGALTTGSAVAGDFFREHMPDVDFDEARRFLPDAMRQYHAILARELGEDAHFGLSLAGWSDDEAKWTCCIIKSWGGAPRNFEPFVPYSAAGCISPFPMIGGTERPLTDFELAWNYGAFGYLETCRRILLAQRRAKIQNGEGGPHLTGVIGGAGEAVVITAAGVQRVTIIDWSDPIGETSADREARRGSEQGDELLIPSRAERRRAERYIDRSAAPRGAQDQRRAA